jgi:beta-lactamase regulating signal transducer with metallopeptidase domain
LSSPALDSFSAAAVRWLVAAALDGTLFAALCWMLSVTLLRRAGGRVLSVVWLAALLRFVLWAPVEVHAVPLATARTAAPHIAAHGTTCGLIAAYLAVVVALVLRLLIRQRRLRRSVAALDPAESAIVERVRIAAGELRLAGLPDVRVTLEDVPPFIAGTARPTLILPRWLCEPAPRLHAVLLHELAHLKRGDQLVLWLEQLIACLFFFWPPVHWVTRKLQEERELACDERALERGMFAATDYANLLLDVVARTRGQVAHEALAIGRTAQRLERRIDRLLEDAVPRRPTARQATILLGLLVAALIAFRPQLPPPLAAVAPELPVFGACAAQAAALANDCSDGSCALQCGP